MPDKEEVLQALKGVMDPELDRSIVELNMVRGLSISPQGDVQFTIALTIPDCPLRDSITASARAAVQALPGVKSVKITLGAMSDAEREAILGRKQTSLPKLSQFNKVEHMLAVMSGKGGVGKSSLTALLAVALARSGKRVGILDADITGPSIPKLFGLPSGGLRSSPQGILPATSPGGIRIISTNLLLPDEGQPVIWRGPMISSAIQQFWNDVLWGNLDYLLVDMPPGTSDAALTVGQSLPLNGVILVTSPQLLSSMVVHKAVGMVQALKVPILGVVENFSYYTCPDTGKPHEIFGPSHAGGVAAAAGVPLWARLPIDPQVAALCDAGRVEEVQMPEIQQLLAQLEK